MDVTLNKRKYREPPRGKNMRSDPNGNNARKCKMSTGLRWQTSKAASHRGPNAVGCVGYDAKA